MHPGGVYCYQDGKVVLLNKVRGCRAYLKGSRLRRAICLGVHREQIKSNTRKTVPECLIQVRLKRPLREGEHARRVSQKVHRNVPVEHHHGERLGR